MDIRHILSTLQLSYGQCIVRIFQTVFCHFIPLLMLHSTITAKLSQCSQNNHDCVFLHVYLGRMQTRAAVVITGQRGLTHGCVTVPDLINIMRETNTCTDLVCLRLHWTHLDNNRWTLIRGWNSRGFAVFISITGVGFLFLTLMIESSGSF